MIDSEALKQRLARGGVVLFCIFAGVCIWGYRSFHAYLAGYEPKHFSEVRDIRLMQILSHEKRPVLVYFYHRKNSSIPRVFLPALDEVASRYSDQIPIYGHRLREQGAEKFQPYRAADCTMVIFRKGREVQRINTFYAKKQDNVNMLVSILAEYLGKD